jgi:micrococcal nuclease
MKTKKNKFFKKMVRRLKYRFKRLSILAVTLIIIAILAIFQSPDERIQSNLVPQASEGGINFSGSVFKIIDGDTFSLRGHTSKIRVWGLDAPEMNTSLGRRSKEEMHRLIDGKTLKCERKDIDTYGRTVARCTLPNGADIAREMINSGVAKEYCYYSRNAYGNC